jgi:hypothetical protein
VKRETGDRDREREEESTEKKETEVCGVIIRTSEA